MKDWAGTGEAYSASYAPLCAGTSGALLDALGAAVGRTALDVGAGTGLVAAAFSDAGWQVTGCEPEPSMRDVALRRRPETVMVDGALPHLPFGDAAFDVVVANFVLNHVADPRESARELVRVAAEQAAATIWTSSPTWLWREVCDRAGLIPPAGERLPPEKDFGRSREGFERMLQDAGWRRTVVSEISWTWQAAPEELWASAVGGVGAAGQFHTALDGTGRALFRKGFDLVCAERSVDGFLPLRHSAAIGVGSRH